MQNINSQKALGLVLTIAGLAFFIVLMGDLLFRVVGGILAITLANYGLQMQGLPNIWVYSVNLFNFKR